MEIAKTSFKLFNGSIQSSFFYSHNVVHLYTISRNQLQLQHPVTYPGTGCTGRRCMCWIRFENKIHTHTNTQLQLCLKICSIKICRDKVSDTSMTTRFDTSRKSRLFTSVRSWCFIDPVLYCFSRFHKACGGQRAISQSFPDTSLCIWSEAPNRHVISSYRLLENYIQARTLPDQKGSLSVRVLCFCTTYYVLFRW